MEGQWKFRQGGNKEKYKAKLDIPGEGGGGGWRGGKVQNEKTFLGGGRDPCIF